MQDAPDKQLDLKLLERSLGRAEKSAAAWLRDTGILAVLVLLFQFTVFQPAVRLYERQATVDRAALPLQRTETSLRQLDESSAEIGKILNQGRAAVDELLRRAPTDLRREILAFDEEMQAYRRRRNPPDSGSAAVPDPAAAPDPSQFPIPTDFPSQSPGAALPPMPMMQSQVPLPSSLNSDHAPHLQAAPARSRTRFLEGLTAEQLDLIAAPDDDPSGFRALVQQLVTSKIIEPRFERLNRSKRAQLDVPLAEIGDRLVQPTRRLAARLGRGADSFASHLTDLTESVARLRSMRLEAPAGNPDWWRSFAGKGAVAEGNRISIEQVIVESQDSLGRMGAGMNAASRSFRHMLDQIKRERTDLKQQLSEVERQYQEVRTLLGELGKPFSFITARLDQAVGGFPTVLLLACAWLLWRLNRLRAHGASLYRAFVRHSASDVALRAAIPALAQPTGPTGTTDRWPVLVVAGALVLLAFYDLFALRDTLGFPGTVGRVLFAAATLLLIAGVYSALRPTGHQDGRN